jgi:hypothetical protein
MTGSGKTGLGIIYVEEALLRGIPTLIIDPKGDMTNLLLTFPDLLPEDFAPWIDAGDARRKEQSVPELAAATADLWRNGLAGWDIDGSRIAALRNAADFTIYTPGSARGVPINLVGSLRRPDLDWDTDVALIQDEIQSFVSGLLGLIGLDADPIASREHILLSNVIGHAWRAGNDLDLDTLLAWVQRPPMRKLGVFDVDAFFPIADRTQLAMRLNGLVASPAFADWMQGPPLDAERLLWSPSGKVQASILYLAHLSDEERQFVVALALSKLVTWMRRQPGTGGLRALVYLDEAFGFAPPVGEPPAKTPILTILKQARAFGLGMIVATQNPMDLDYKAMSNAGTWNIGRLQTERDKARILEGLESAGGTTDVATFDTLISGLGKRRFVLHSSRRKTPEVFTTRWAMSYLRGPLTGPQISGLMEDAVGQHAPPLPATAESQELAGNETRVMPSVADGVPVRYMDPAAPWARTVGADPTSRRLRAALAVRLSLLYDEARAGIEHREEWEAVLTPLGDPVDVSSAIEVDHDGRDFLTDAPENATFVLPEAPIDTSAYFRSAGTALKDRFDRTSAITIFRNRELGLYSRVGETREEFEGRCDRAADGAADDAAAKLRDRYETRLTRAHDQYEAAQRRVEEIEVDLTGARRTEWTDLAGTVIDFLSGRRSARRAGSTARQRATVRSKEQRLRSARDKAEDREEAIEDLTADLENELEALTSEWEEKARQIEDLDIGLEKSDIAVEEIVLVWIPV